MARAVMASPGGPAAVLLDDQNAEHIPGCNMAFWKWALEEVGGFDPIFRRAGDDVGECLVGAARRRAAPGLGRAVTEHLRSLAMPDATVEVRVGDADPGDEVEIRLKENVLIECTTGTRRALNPLGEIAPIVEAGGVFEYAKRSGML